MRVLFLLPLGAVLLAAGNTSPELPALPPPTPLMSPAQGRAGMPQLTEFNGRVLLSWVEMTGATATLKFAERAGAGWSAAQTVASGADWFVNWADVPSVLRLDDARLSAHWLQKSGPDTYAYDVRLSLSADNGASWTRPTTPHHDGTKTEHGFASLFREAGGGLGLIWLDGRAMTPGSHGHGGGAMTVRAARFDRTGKQVSESLVDDRVCECCPTAAAVTSDGPIVVYRDRAAGEVRDIYASRLVRGTWTTPSAVFADKWEFPACPVNGPAISAAERSVVVSWFTMRDGVGHAYGAFSGDAGTTFGAPIRMDDEASLGRVDVELLDHGRAVASWLEYSGNRAEWKMRLVASDGRRGPATTIAKVTSSRSSGYPRIARGGREMVLAWTDASIEPATVRTAAVRLY
jgi:hypothetical protein